MSPLFGRFGVRKLPKGLFLTQRLSLQSFFAGFRGYAQ